jgi:hypothetical protein
MHILPIHLLWGSLQLSIWPLHQELLSLHQKLGALYLHWHLWPIHLRRLEELVRLREVVPNIVFKGLSMEWHLPLAIILHFLDFIFNNDGLVDHMLEIHVVGVEQLELNIIIQSIHKHVLLLIISVEVLSGISQQLYE